MSRRNSKSANGTSEPISADSGNIGETGSGADRDSSADAGGTATTIDPATVGANGNGDSADSGTVKRRRGRPPGSGNTAKAKPIPSDVSGIEKLLFGAHMMLAHMFAPEFAMETDEAKEIAKAIADVNRHYNVRLLDQKTMDWIYLIQTVGVAYGGRIMGIRRRKAAEKRGPAVVRTMPQNARTTQNPAQDIPMPDFQRATNDEARAAEVPGLGKVQLPPDHPLFTEGMRQ